MIPIKTASNMCKWMGQQIGKNPCIISLKKVELSIPRVVFHIMHNTLTTTNGKTKNKNSVAFKIYKNDN